MHSTGIAPARIVTALASVNTDHDTSNTLKSAVPACLPEGAHWFYWIVGLACVDSFFTILGSHLHRFTRLGITAIVDGLANESVRTGALHVIVAGWAAGGFLLLGYCAAEGQGWAFAVGMAAYAVDAAMLVVAHDYLGLVFHAFVLLAIFRDLLQLSIVKPEPQI